MRVRLLQDLLEELATILLAAVVGVDDEGVNPHPVAAKVRELLIDLGLRGEPRFHMPLVAAIVVNIVVDIDIVSLGYSKWSVK